MVWIQGDEIGSETEGDGIAEEHDTLRESMPYTFYYSEHQSRPVEGEIKENEQWGKNYDRLNHVANLPVRFDHLIFVFLPENALQVERCHSANILNGVDCKLQKRNQIASSESR